MIETTNASIFKATVTKCDLTRAFHLVIGEVTIVLHLEASEDHPSSLAMCRVSDVVIKSTFIDISSEVGVFAFNLQAPLNSALESVSVRIVDLSAVR